MKTSLFTLAALCLQAAAPAAAAAEAWYVEAGVTAARVSDLDQTISNAPAPGATMLTSSDIENGFGGRIAFGRGFGSLRAEAEIGRTEHESDSFSIRAPFTATLNQDHETTITRYMLNLYYDFGADGARLRPFVGVGAGSAEVSLKRVAGIAINPAAPPFTHYDDADSGFAWQLMAGVSWALDERWSLTGQYRRFDAGEYLIHTRMGQPVRGDIAANEIDFGVRLNF